MPTINFYTDKPDRKGKCPIMMTYQDNGKKFRYYTKQKIEADYWKGQRVKKQCASGAEVNGILQDLENIINGILREAVFSKQTYSVEVVKRKFQSQIGSLGESNDFYNSFEQFIEVCKSKRSFRTIQAYRTTRNTLLDYQDKRQLQ